MQNVLIEFTTCDRKISWWDLERMNAEYLDVIYNEWPQDICMEFKTESKIFWCNLEGVTQDTLMEFLKRERKISWWNLESVNAKHLEA